MNLGKLWEQLTQDALKNGQSVRLLVDSKLLYRVYIGVESITNDRFVLIELPERSKREVLKFIRPQGIIVKFVTTGQEKNGFVSCLLKVAASEMNDVFSIVLSDILLELSNCHEESQYTNTLKYRLEKWEEFFRQSKKEKLNENLIIGLFGELQFIKDLSDKGFSEGDKLWNGPIRAEQDFQTEGIAVEVKTTRANKIDEIQISSLEQLDICQRKKLFLCVYRIKNDDLKGITLPQFIQDIRQNLPDERKRIFDAKLKCLGYDDSLRELYSERYSVCENEIFEVTPDFPKLVKSGIAPEISKVSYRIRLGGCSEYIKTTEDVIQAIKGE